ncbi:hypothetical protein L1987_49820 [Smallanthus sonchifolius]|uniref:Uncharacterized protein n=1 Tax=Smallanthus sonchifolius TaxID=185202 RepID=A0ACB9FVR8_9ASTR|nr:hypothetical protein L1987_49820 [Smallanthus sonchifolius]
MSGLDSDKEQYYRWENIFKAGRKLAKADIDIGYLLIGKMVCGEPVNFSLDNWEELGKLKDCYPLLFVLESEKSCKMSCKTMGEALEFPKSIANNKYIRKLSFRLHVAIFFTINTYGNCIKTSSLVYNIKREVDINDV